MTRKPRWAFAGRAAIVKVRVRDLCRRGAYSVAPDAPLAQVLHDMAERYLDSVLAVKDGKLLGSFTAIDALKHHAAVLTGK